MTESSLVQSGAALVRDINTYDSKPGRFALWWLGQHSFIAKCGGTVLYLDPFLTAMPGRTVPPLVDPAEVTNADVICGSHDHADHIDRPVWPALASASPGALFIVPDLLRERLAHELPLAASRLVGLDEGRSVEIAGVRITAVASAHEFFDRCPSTGRYPYLGFVFEGNGCCWYHAGDTVWYDGLQAKLSRWRLDAMLLPINGRDAVRLRQGIIGNMTYQEAADLAGPLDPGLVIPTHYDMFVGNPGDPEAFQDYMAVKYPHVRTHVCRYGQRLEILSQG